MLILMIHNERKHRRTLQYDVEVDKNKKIIVFSFESQQILNVIQPI